MSPPPRGVARTNRWLFNAEDPVRVEAVLADTCCLLDHLGVHVAPTKVKRLIDKWNDKVRFTGYGLPEWIANGLALNAEREQRVAWGLRNAFGAVDVTGQRAARAADRALGLSPGWHE